MIYILKMLSKKTLKTGAKQLCHFSKKKKATFNYANYTISFISHTSNVKIIINRQKPHTENIVAEKHF